jgi:hypothetical protein
VLASEKSEHDDLLHRLTTNSHLRTDVARKIKNAYDTYNATLSSRACKALYIKCPRELRDMVYAYVTAKEVVVNNSRLDSEIRRYVALVFSSQCKT